MVVLFITWNDNGSHSLLNSKLVFCFHISFSTSYFLGAYGSEHKLRKLSVYRPRFVKVTIGSVFEKTSFPDQIIAHTAPLGFFGFFDCHDRRINRLSSQFRTSSPIEIKSESGRICHRGREGGLGVLSALFKRALKRAYPFPSPRQGSSSRSRFSCSAICRADFSNPSTMMLEMRWISCQDGNDEDSNRE